MASESWLLLTHHVPAVRSSVRVRTWRRLQDIGALPARNAVYVLPDLKHCRMDLDEVRREIVKAGGEATLFAGRPLENAEHDRLIALFRDRSAREYRTIGRTAERLRASAAGPRTRARARSGTFRRSLAALRARTDQIRRRDFFQAPGRADLDAALARLDAIVGGHEVSERPTSATGPLTGFQRRRWVTRPRPGVDRMASAWLIRRHIDPDATFAFVERPSGDDVPFDMHEGEFTHQDGMCTFETLADRFGLHTRVVERLGRVVHDLDLKDDRYRLPETAAIGRLIDGLRHAHRDDAILLEQGIALFEALGSVVS